MLISKKKLDELLKDAREEIARLNELVKEDIC